MKILETQRLLLRHLAPDDVEDLFTFYSDPDVFKYIPDAPRTYQEAREELEWHMNGHPTFPDLGLWATIFKETDQFVGRCGLIPWTIDGQHDVEVAFALARPYWGRGLATEVAQALVHYGFEHLKLSRLICVIDQENQASITVATKIGMRFEREAKDEYGPFLIYSMST
ncbi:MAG: GNAT family N-acetyltransferase [Chloroflexota bacterium]|nr:GNAT family N-acetyltransferase [Chloroflexota bacterium]